MCWCACVGLRSAFWKVSSNCGITTFHRSFNEDLQKYAERDTNASPAHYPQPRGDTHEKVCPSVKHKLIRLIVEAKTLYFNHPL